MLNGKEVGNGKPRLKVAASNQGNIDRNSNSNSTMFGDGKTTPTNRQELDATNRSSHNQHSPGAFLERSRSRHDKGMELYKSGKVSIGDNGLFRVSGYYEVDTEKMTCTCPDYQKRHEPCKHVFAACLYVKYHSKESVEHFDGHVINSNGAKVQPETKEPSPKPLPLDAKAAQGKDFNRQATITRLAVINSAIEIVKTWGKPVEFSVVISLASELEKWAKEGK